MRHLIAAAPFLGGVVSGTSLMAGGNPLVNWAAQYLVTLAFELPMVVVAWRFRGCPGILRVWLIGSILGNLISHPLATFAGTMMGLPAGGFMAVVNYMLIETSSIAIEAWVFHWRATSSWSEAAVMSFAANAVTAVFGAYLLFLN
jgi:hypothetical protein